MTNNATNKTTNKSANKPEQKNDTYNELSKNGISIYDTISVRWKGKTLTGMVFPKYNETKPNVIVMKLDSGYNIGVKVNNIKDVKLLKKFKDSNVRKASNSNSRGGVSKHDFKNKVAVLGCGGTIASRIEYKTGAVYPVSTKEEMEELIPEIKKVSNISFLEVMGILSEDMNPDHWEIISRSVYDAIKKGAKGVVLLHGTDTMHYTSAALSFSLENLPVPVILVGAQRSSDRPSTDSHINFLNAVFSSEQDFAEVGVCMHANMSDTYAYLHRGTRVRKMHTSRRDAFKSVGISPLAKVDYKKGLFEKLYPYKRRNPKMTDKFELKDKFNRNVALIYYYPGMKPDLIAGLDKFDGVVIAGTGLGHVSTNPFGDKHAIPIINEIKDLVQSNIPVVMSPQTIYGRIDMNVYTAGRLLKEAGVIGNGADWIPETAYVKLSHVLAYEKNMKKIEESMMTNIAGEITKRSEIY